ncbi:MAG: GMC family oxidoreductase [Deltaproteobacteria bacterium]|nr:GMC family oxidoreductase [Deltaproteobacteria bacterium]
MVKEYDLIVVGSGAGAGPIIKAAADAGKSVCVLEKGAHFTEKDFVKDEVTVSMRERFRPSQWQEPRILESKNDEGGWDRDPTYNTGFNFHNGSVVGGSSNFMSGFFHRMKPMDFRLRSEFGAIDDANVEDWPISYDDLEPFYAKVEQVVGVSGKVVKHPMQEPRSTPDYPMPPTMEHPLGKLIDEAAPKIGLHAFPVARAVLSQPKDERRSCEYAGWCGSYGCTTGAKGNARVAFILPALKTGHVDLLPRAKAFHIHTDAKGLATGISYYDEKKKEHLVKAKAVVVACQAIESSRLLLSSTGEKHPAGIGNRYGQVGKNLVFSAHASGKCDLTFKNFSADVASALASKSPFVNRAVQDHYIVDHFDDDKRRMKGGTIDYLLRHPNPIRAAKSLSNNGGMTWGVELQKRVQSYFSKQTHLIFEVFMDWIPSDICYVRLDDKQRDKWGAPTANVRVGRHPHHKKLAKVMGPKGAELMKALGGENITTRLTGGPATNLQAGGCRFGNDAKTSVLDVDCRVHDAPNVFVTDGSFMPTGGSVPFTFTIYANAMRVAEKVVSSL